MLSRIQNCERPKENTNDGLRRPPGAVAQNNHLSEENRSEKSGIQLGRDDVAREEQMDQMPSG